MNVYTKVSQIVLSLSIAFMSAAIAQEDPLLPEIDTKSVVKIIRPITKDEMKELRKNMENFLKDASSAIYKDVFIAVEADGTKHACGSLNAKNSYGGYVGFRRFTSAMLLLPHFEGPSDGERYAFSQISWKTYCTLQKPK